MLKRRDSPYVAGRRAGLWYKWKRDPLTADCVMMYAQRGSGRRSSFYSDYTFGCWTEEGELLPVGKAYSGFTDEELKMLDSFVRNHTLNRFGPVREVEKTLVLGDRVRFDPRIEAPQIGRGDALPADRAHPHRQARGGGGPDRDAEADDHVIRASWKRRGRAGYRARSWYASGRSGEKYETSAHGRGTTLAARRVGDRHPVRDRRAVRLPRRLFRPRSGACVSRRSACTRRDRRRSRWSTSRATWGCGSCSARRPRAG